MVSFQTSDSMHHWASGADPNDQTLEIVPLLIQSTFSIQPLLNCRAQGKPNGRRANAATAVLGDQTGNANAGSAGAVTNQVAAATSSSAAVSSDGCSIGIDGKYYSIENLSLCH